MRLMCFIMWTKRLLLLAVSVGSLGASVQAQTTTLLANTGPEKRFALLIGNAAYPSAPLTNPVNDVRAMSQALRAAGFEVMSAENVGRIQMLRLVREFGDKLLNSGGVGVFYFAGHGLQIKGRNYLVPVDAQVTGEDEASYDSMDADFVLQKMGEAKNRVNLIILDACRNNPFVKNRSTAGGGLAQMDAPVGSLVAYATAPGSVASDGAGANGLYTQHLVSAIAQKGLAVEEVFKQVRANVRRDSQGKQIPWENTALEGQFFFYPPESVTGVQQANPHAQTTGPAVLEIGASERGAWEQARRGGVADVERFLQQYPAGRFVQEARDRLAALRAEQAAAAVASRPPASPAPPPPAPAAPVAVLPPPQAPAQPAVTVSPGAPAAPPQTGKVSLQTLAGMVGSNAQVTPSPPPPAPVSTPASTVVAPGAVWNYVIASATGGEQAEQIRVVSTAGGWQKLSNGTEIHEDGRVRAVRFGSYLIKAVSDESFLRLPLRAGLNGANTAQVIDMQGRASNARVIWRTESAGNIVKLHASVDGVTFVMRYEASFAQDQVLPVRYESEMKNRLAGGVTQVVTARLQ